VFEVALLDCDSSCRGFEPHQPPQFPFIVSWLHFSCSCGKNRGCYAS